MKVSAPVDHLPLVLDEHGDVHEHLVQLLDRLLELDEHLVPVEGVVMLVPINPCNCTITPGSHLLSAIYVGQSTSLRDYRIPPFQGFQKAVHSCKHKQAQTN